MNVRLIISDLLETPLNFLPGKFYHHLRKKLHTAYYLHQRRKGKADLGESNLKSSFRLEDLGPWPAYDAAYALLFNLFREHRFDILGSGWVSWRYDAPPPGFMGISYPEFVISPDFDSEGHWLTDIVHPSQVDASSKIWRTLRGINSDYIPIDWQKDCKTGFRYDGRLDFNARSLTNARDGVDVKVPWELGRLQHLPVMIAMACGGGQTKEITTEIKCQVLDFIMSNPPGFGIQWKSAMDVSIRLLILTHSADALRQLDSGIADSPFWKILTASIKAHVEFSFRFREWNGGIGNNHYLSNLTGLLSGLYALSDDSHYSGMLRRTVNCLLNEITRQFLRDGGNFESSLPYHYFASECAILSLALIKRMKEASAIEVNGELYSRAVERIARASTLMKDALRNDGHICQIGDNDSSRLIYWTFSFNTRSVKEALLRYSHLNQVTMQGMSEFIDRNMLDYSQVIDMSAALFDESANRTLHGSFILSIARKAIEKNHYGEIHPEISKMPLESLPFVRENDYDLALQGGQSLLTDLKFRAYPDFGVYIFKSPSLFLMVNATNRRVVQYWPHGHNDKLSFELWMDGKAMASDPGSFVYTPSPSERNRYRSINAHNTAIFGEAEQNEWIDSNAGVFRMKQQSKVSVLAFHNRGITLLLEYGSVMHVREFLITERKVTVTDKGNKEFRVNNGPFPEFSPGYGKKLKAWLS